MTTAPRTTVVPAVAPEPVAVVPRSCRPCAAPHLCHVFPCFGTGGPEVRTAMLIDTFGDEFRHTVVALDGTLTCAARLRRPEAVRLLVGPPRRGRLRHPLDLARLLRSLAPDAILTYGWGGTDAVLAARLAGIRRVAHAEEGFLPEERQRQKPARLWARRALLRLADRVIVPSQALVRIARRDWWLPARKVVFVPNGVDLTRFAPPSAEEIDAARQRLGLPVGAVIVGTVGRLDAVKNQARLVRAFAAAAAGRPAHLLLVGDGPLRAELQEQVKAVALAGRVTFTGNLADPRDAYRAMDVFALPSDTEQMPLVLLEAMATGLPAVSTGVGDVAAMVPAEQTRFVVPPADEGAFAARLVELLDGAELRRSLGAVNREECRRRFDQAAMVAAYRRMYRELAGR